MTSEANTRRPPATLVFCVALAVIAIWGHRYPPGTDLPQHANLFRLWTELSSGPLEYRSLYHVTWFTPYLLTYLVAYPFTKLFGALVASKVLLTVAVVGTYVTLTRWLTVIGADARLGLLGLVLGFGFAYQCGFLSQDVSLVPAFGYLAAFEAQGDRPTPRQVIATAVWGLVLFFTHGIAFGIFLLASGLRLLLRRRPWVAYRAAIHMVPIAVVCVLWVTSHATRTSEAPGKWFFDRDRLITLFSGVVYTTSDVGWALVVAGAIVILVVAGRLRPSAAPAALVPFLVALVAFLVLPDWIAGTWLVGTRLCVYVHAFVLGVVRPKRTPRVERLFPTAVVAMTALALLSLNFRLFWWDREMRGFHELTAKLPAHEDVQTSVEPAGGHKSQAFGQGEFGQVPAWVTALGGGIVENDSAGAYYWYPIQRNRVPFPTRFRYVIAKGPARDVLAAVRKNTRDAREIGRVDDWFLFERPPLSTGGIRVVRDAQGWGSLQVDRAVTKAKLSIGGQPFAHGFGAHAPGFLRIHATRPGGSLRGACGVDDAAPEEGQLSFRIRDDAGTVLFQSGPMGVGEAPKRFAVPVPESRELLLEMLPEGSQAGDHADWVDLDVGDAAAAAEREMR